MAKLAARVPLLLAPALLSALRAGSSVRMISAGAAACGKEDISVAVSSTGGEVGGQPTYAAAVATTCRCPMTGVRVWCAGVKSSAAPVDASKGQVVEGMCVLQLPVAAGAPVIFTYSAAVPVHFRVFNADTAC